MINLLGTDLKSVPEYHLKSVPEFLSPVESLVEFIQRETVFLGAVALDGK
jgi:hypothetical protein